MLKCETTNYNRSGYNEEWAKTWVPLEHQHVVDGDKIEHKNWWGEGRIVKNLNDKFEFHTLIRDHKQTPTIKGTYFKKNGKFVVKVIFPSNLALQNSKGIWGECVERPLSVESLSENNSSDKTPNQIAGLDFVHVGGSDATDVYVSKDTGLVKIVSGLRHFRGAVDEMILASTPKADAAVKFFDDKDWEFKKYKLSWVKTRDLHLVEEDGVRTMYFSFSGARELLNPPDRYFTIGTENTGTSGAYWWATNNLEAKCYSKSC